MKPIKSVKFTNTMACPQIYKTQRHSTITVSFPFKKKKLCHSFTFPLQTQRPSSKYLQQSQSPYTP